MNEVTMFFNKMEKPDSDHNREYSTFPKFGVKFWFRVGVEFHLDSYIMSHTFLGLESMNPLKAGDSMFMERRSLMQVCILNLTKMDKI